ncbi:GA-like domain-containing protein, partial [Rodentibacter pneumotropicus]
TLDALKADADAAKAKADEAVKGLPADNAAKDELQGRVDAIDNRVPDVTPDQTDSSNWGVDTDGWIENDSTADNPPDTDPSDESGEDNTPQLDPTVIVTGRTVLSNPTNAVMTKIRDKNPNVPTTQIQKVGSQAQFVTGEEDNTVVVGKGDKDNISGKNSITNGLIQTNGGSDKVVITNNSINTVIDTGADNDSVDIYGNLRHTGATAPESKIDTGNGDDVLTIRGRITGLKNQLMMGDGDDTVIVAGGATGNTTAQNNMQTKTNWNAIDLGEGNDKLSMGEKGPGNIQYTDIQAGIGDDVVILKPNRGKGDLLWVNVDLGDGNDSIVVAATDIRNVYISGGAGNDTIDLSASSTQTDATRSRVISSKVDGGEGNDHIILGKIDYVDDYPVDVTGGAGDDVITFTQDYAPFLTSNRIGASISGGDGFDTVAIKGTAMISLASGTAGTQKLPEGIINFESIDMTASGGQTVKLTASDVLANSGMLYIAGDSSDTVDLGNDGSSSLGGFTKTAETTARIALDGKEHTYTAYSNGDVKVYIDDQITNII